MRFYMECAEVAEKIAAQMTREALELFIETEYSELFRFHFSWGMWIRNHCLDPQGYLYKALNVLGKETRDEMSMFLLGFAQQYLTLKRASLL